MKKSTLAVATLLAVLASVPAVSIAYADDDTTTTNPSTTSSGDDTQGTQNPSEEGDDTSSDH